MHKTLGSVLKQARLDSRFSLRDLAKVSGLTASQISQIESGKRADPGFRTISKIVKALRISMDDLAAECGYVERSEKGGSLMPSSREYLDLIRGVQAAGADAERLVDRLSKLSVGRGSKTSLKIKKRKS